jgi:hypothetical protein
MGLMGDKRKECRILELKPFGRPTRLWKENVITDITKHDGRSLDGLMWVKDGAKWRVVCDRRSESSCPVKFWEFIRLQRKY